MAHRLWVPDSEELDKISTKGFWHMNPDQICNGGISFLFSGDYRFTGYSQKRLF